MKYGITDENSDPRRIPQLSDWHRIFTSSSSPYFTLADVLRVYTILNEGSNKGVNAFSTKVRVIAKKVPSNAVTTGYIYQFVDENALFNLFMETFPQKMVSLGISNWSRLMQYIS